MKIVVLDGHTTNRDDLSWSELEMLGDLNVYDWTQPEDVVERLIGAQAAFTNKVKLDADIIAALPELKYIGIMATGMDCVDLEAARKTNIVVTNVPEYANYSVSQLAFALILELCYRIDLHHRSITEEKLWSRQPYNSYWLKSLNGLNGKVLGIIGMGKIGERVASIGAAFGMKIYAYDLIRRELPDVNWVDLHALLRESDVVSLHCPLLDSTRGLINRNTLEMMKPTSYLINTSRGPLVVEQDLADALNAGVIAGAGLDVLEKEPPLQDNPLLYAKNAILTPHIGWATLESRERLITEVAMNYKAFLHEEKRNIVNASV